MDQSHGPDQEAEVARKGSLPEVATAQLSKEQKNDEDGNGIHRDQVLGQ